MKKITGELIFKRSVFTRNRYQSLKTALLALLFIIGTYSTHAQTKGKFSTALEDASLVKKLKGFSNGYETVNGVKLHYVSGGEGQPLILLSGWPETWWSFHKIMPQLATKYKVIAIDYRGMGSSDKPLSGYDKKTVSADIYALMSKLGYKNAYVAGHDIGAQVAFSLAANYPEFVTKLVIMDVPHPDDSFASVLMLPALGTPTDKLDPARPYLWWFAFNQMKGLPEDLLTGRFEIAQKYIFNYLLLKDSSIDSFDRAVFAKAYNSASAIRAGNGWYQAFSQDIADYKSYKTLTMPVLGLGGPGYDWLRFTLPNKSSNLKVKKITDSGHFIAEEQPGQVLTELFDFLK